MLIKLISYQNWQNQLVRDILSRSFYPLTKKTPKRSTGIKTEENFSLRNSKKWVHTVGEWRFWNGRVANILAIIIRIIYAYIIFILIFEIYWSLKCIADVRLGKLQSERTSVLFKSVVEAELRQKTSQSNCIYIIYSLWVGPKKFIWSTKTRSLV